MESLGVVESWTEWDRLREVWVGSLENKSLDAPQEPAVARKMACYQKYNWPVRDRLQDADCLAEAKKQLDNYIEVLKQEGIIVQRPKVFDTQVEIKTPMWSVERMSGFTCPRDLFFVAGKQVIEAPMSWRCRYFEHLAWRDLLMSYYKSDPRMRWSAAPKPMLVDDSFGGEGEERSIRNSEIFFDAADSRRFGRDVFFQSAHTANDLGREWVRRELAAQGVRVQDFDFQSQQHFSHIDARLTPVDEGLCFYSSMDPPTDAMLQLFRENEWNILDAGFREDCRSTSDQCAPGIHLNVLTIAPKVCIVEKNEKKLIKLLSDEGCDVLPIEFSACYPWGGALNCYTLDIHRDGPAQKSYFPTLDMQAERQAAKSEKP
mmetsp:Transcript_40025/g.95588  ORF Transcript_40025/g.95588 Transcript_40025/m.95588 type:complete len:374 (+) Transcript_40025:55-1176(+)